MDNGLIESFQMGANIRFAKGCGPPSQKYPLMPWGFPVNSDSPSADLSFRPELGGFASADLEPVSVKNPNKDQAMAAKKKAKKKAKKAAKKTTRRVAKKATKKKAKKKATKKKAAKRAPAKKAAKK